MRSGLLPLSMMCGVRRRERRLDGDDQLVRHLVHRQDPKPIQSQQSFRKRRKTREPSDSTGVR
jgi:hypothetical protein